MKAMRWWLPLALLFAAGAAAQDQAPARDSAPVKVANRTIIVLRGPIAGYSAAERAAMTRERIERALDAESLPAVSLEQTADGMTRVRLGGAHAFLVTPIDIDTQAGETMLVVAQQAALRLERTVRELREQATVAYLARATALAVAATLAAALLFLLILRARRWLRARMAAVADLQSRKLIVGGVPLLGASHLLALTYPLPGIAAGLALLFVAWAWLGFVLARFPYTRPWGEELGARLLDILGRAGLAVLEALPELLLVVVVVFVARAIIRIARVFFDRIEQGRIALGRLDADTVRPTRQIFTIVVWVFALAMAYPYLPGASTDAFKGLSVLAGVMISLGGASVVGQAFSGLALMYNGAIRAGEYVRIGEVEGTVKEITMFVTRLRTGLGEELTLPNSTVMSSGIKNYSRSHEGTGFVLDASVSIGYATPWRQVHAMLLEAARRTPGVVQTPAPYVRQTALEDFYVVYRLVTYSSAERSRARANVLSDLHANIQDVFNEHGVQIMSPNYEADPAEPKLVLKENWYPAPAKPPA
jgi:small-conductance mechanosensitive channel